jgi:hypothetical protein
MRSIVFRLILKKEKARGPNPSKEEEPINPSGKDKRLGVLLLQSPCLVPPSFLSLQNKGHELPLGCRALVKLSSLVIVRVAVWTDGLRTESMIHSLSSLYKEPK